MKKSMHTCRLLTLTIPEKQNSQNWPYFECNYLEKPTSAHMSFTLF